MLPFDEFLANPSATPLGGGRAYSFSIGVDACKKLAYKLPKSQTRKHRTGHYIQGNTLSFKPPLEKDFLCFQALRFCLQAF